MIKFKRGIKHPGETDLIYYPELFGLPKKPTVGKIVDLAMRKSQEDVKISVCIGGQIQRTIP